MILRVILQNFLSFDNEVQFDMFPNMKRTSLSGHIYTPNDKVAVLKMAAIYGGNGSGKSNLLKGINFLKELAVNKHFLSYDTIDNYFYKLKSDAKAQPVSLAIEFITQNGEPYIYTVDIAKNGIVAESLYESGLGQSNNVLVFDRKYQNATYSQVNSSEVTNIVQDWMKQNPFASLLTINSDMPILNDKRINTVRQWFTNELEIIGLHFFILTLISLFKNRPDLKDFASKIFKAVNLGINTVKVQTENLEDWSSTHNLDGASLDKINNLRNGVLSQIENFRNTRSFSIDNGIKKINQMMFEQCGKNGFVCDMDINTQSDGTVRLLSLVPAFYDAMQNGKTVIIDELDHSIHPSLVLGLIRYFSSSKTNGQLLFTTHQTALMNQEFIRTDEVWLVEKVEGATRMYSLNDFKIHNTINIANGYMAGRYGAIPFIGEFNF